MIRNYLKIAWRNLLKNKQSSVINIGGLAIGMSVALLIGLWIRDELTYNRYHENYDRVARIMQNQTGNGQVYTGEAIPFPLGEELKTQYGDNFKYLAMASWQGDHILSVGNDYQNKNGIYIDREGPRILSLKMQKGTPDGLADPHGILLSESAARSFFGDGDPMGRLMKINNSWDVKVTGVFGDLPQNTEFRDLEFIAAWDLYVTTEPWLQRARTQWRNNSFQGFVQISDHADFASVNKKIINAKIDKQPEEDKKYKAEIFLQPMCDWHLRSEWKNGVQTGGQIEYVKMFSVIGVFVLLLACINFMNLSTARSEKRAREVGIRKAVGSARRQLIGQFLCESTLVAGIGLLLALLLTLLLLPWFNGVAGKQMSIPWAAPDFWSVCILFTLVTGLLAGSYPALFLSSFQPVKVLKGTFKAGKLAGLPRKALVVVQFTVSVALIIGTVIVYQQIQYTKNRPVGYDREGLLMIEMKSQDFYGKYEVLRSELKRRGAILEMSESSSPLTGVWSNSGGFYWEGKDPNLDTDFATFWVTHEYGKTAGFEMAAGRDFSRDFPTDSSAMLINEAAVKFMNLEDPVGKTIRWESGNRLDFTIIGVVKDIVATSPFKPVKQAVYLLNYENVNWMNFRINPDKSARESLAIIEDVFKKVIPSAPFDYKFADEEYAAKFSQEERIGKLALFFTALAILISCLGLFGLASFVAEQRTKEIGIRKVLGASVAGLWRLLSKEFVLLVVVSCVIAAPVAWYYLDKWLGNYDYRIGIGWPVFALAAAATLIVTLLTVSFQTLKAAVANPVDSLRNE